ncbi:MAG: type II toxin-antitoxin system PrlF family antitoxin [Solirubrobacteraceae bacterium]|jgi:AbrB family looped-hinge helix DNA binding protein|nr:type II toxin-antitoxin system PrlF family antitoxin [Solirubrobacteraceae bacterium]
MRVPAKITSKGQVTVPKQVREALGLAPGDTLWFRLEPGRPAEVSKTEDFLALAGSVNVPPAWRGAPWEAIEREAWRRRRA